MVEWQGEIYEVRKVRYDYQLPSEVGGKRTTLPDFVRLDNGVEVHPERCTRVTRGKGKKYRGM